jgi:acyl carrier protein
LLLKFVREEVAVTDIDLQGDTDLLLTGAVDSLGVIRITQWLEDVGGIDVDPAEVTLENFQTVDRMIAYASTRGS